MDNNTKSIKIESIIENRNDYEKEFERLKTEISNLLLFLYDSKDLLTAIVDKYDKKTIKKSNSGVTLPPTLLLPTQEQIEKIEVVKLQNVEILQEANSFARNEIDNIRNNTLFSLFKDFEEQGKALIIIGMYIEKIKLELIAEGKNPSLKDIYKKLEKTIEEDKNNEYKWLYSTPIESQVKDMDIKTEGNYKYTGPILEFHTSVGSSAIAPLKKFFIEDGKVTEQEFTEEELNNYKKRLGEYNYITSRNADKYYPEGFKNGIKGKLERIEYLWRRRKKSNGKYSNGYAGLTVDEGKTVMINMAGKQMTSDGNLPFTEENNLPDNDSTKKAGVRSKVKTFTHELGHVYDSTTLGDYSKSEEWKGLYSQIHTKENSALLNIGMRNSKNKEIPNEWFARCVDQYIYYPNTKEANIPVTFRGQNMNLKDAMGIILS